MNMIDVAIYGSAGYVTGFSVSSTLMLALVNRAFVTGKPVWRLVAWLAVAVMNLALASFAAIFLMTFYADISSPDYVPRAIAATGGVAPYVERHACSDVNGGVTLEQRVSDVQTQLEYLRQQPWVGEILIAGISEGADVATAVAATSTNKMIKRLGGQRWNRLHKLAYAAAIAGVLHYYMLVKADVTKPVAFGVALAILLGYRALNRVSPAWTERKPARPRAH